jgi:flagellar hook-associated protein 2
LQNKITADKQIGDRGVRVILEGNRLRVQSGRFGKASNIAFLASGDRIRAGVGLLEGQTTPGRDVEGTINGIEAEGNGQLLKAKDGSPNVSGMRLLVKLNERQLNPRGPEAVVKISRGVASRVSQFLGGELDPYKGDVKRVTDGLHTQIKNMDAQLGRLEERIDTKRRALQEKFTRLETQMSKLRSQQSYMSGQLANIGAGGGGLGKGGMVAKLLGGG